MRVTCLVKRWTHHTPSGGYDRLATEVGARIVSRRKVAGVVSQVGQKLWRDRTETGEYLFDYQFGDLLAEANVLAHGAFSPPDLVHVLYGDEQLDRLLRWRRLLRCPLVVTFHQPSHRITHRFDHFQKGLATGIDAAIVVSSEQVEGFEKWVGAKKVVYIPHGIDTTRFCPGDAIGDRNRIMILIVGEHLRDWELIHRVIDNSTHLRLPIDFHVVTKKELTAYFTGCSNIFFHFQIPESELVALYRTADALLVPVTDATANNAVLESLACGTPVITTATGGMSDYVNETGWLLPKGDVTAVMDLLRRMTVNRGVAGSLRDAARIQAVRFDWKTVAANVLNLYATVINGRSPADMSTRVDGTEPVRRRKS
jgi:glycosyltransferase involved in cell wall biosynthesis